MKKTLSLVLVVAIVSSLFAISVSAASVNFTDVNYHWGRDYIIPLAEKGVIKGKTANTFEPDANITRAEFLTLALNVGKIVPVAGTSYTDVSANAWFANTIATAKKNGYIDSNMVKNGRFYPDQNITREEMTAIIVKLYESEQTTIAEGDVTVFSDYGQIASWSKGYVGKAVALGVITGNPDGTFNAQGNATRAEAAVIFSRLSKLMEIKINDEPEEDEEVIIKATRVKVSGDTEIEVGETTLFEATVSPSGVSQTVRWKTSDSSVATVDSNGYVYGVSAGTARITAVSEDGAASGNRTITVEEKQVVSSSEWYYAGTTIPNYTAVTGIPLKNFDTTAKGYPVYMYDNTKYGEYSEVVDYIGCLIETGWKEIMNKTEDFSIYWGFSKNGENVLVTYHADYKEIWITY